MVTLERAGVMLYRHRRQSPAGPLTLLPTIAPLSTIPALTEGDPAMQNQQDGVLLRIFLGESDVHAGHPLYAAIVNEARRLGLAGATVLRGAMGFGANSVLHTTKVVELSTDLPIVIELVDREDNIAKLLPQLETMVQEGMITMEHVRVILYRHNPADA